MYLRVEVLQADAHAVEAQLTQQAHGRPVGFARVNFDAVITRIIVVQIEMLTQLGHQLAQFVMAEKRRCAAAEVQLFDLLFGVEVAGNELYFLLQTLQIRLCAASVLGHDFVAGAVIANVRAERHVDVQRHRAQRFAAFAQGVQQIKRADLAVELHRCGIRGIARSGHVVTAN